MENNRRDVVEIPAVMLVRNGTQTRNAADLSHSCCQAIYIVVQFPVFLYTYALCIHISQ